jgi:hypothetical protein
VRRAAFLAGIAMILQITALFLAWWVINYRDGSSSLVYGSAGLFGADGGVANPAAVWATTVLAVVPVPILFVRVAAASWKHEPQAWRGSLLACGVLMFAALASALAWPRDLPFFWGGRDYVDIQTGLAYSITANPGLGWWLSLAALLAVALAWWMSRPSPAATTEK